MSCNGCRVLRKGCSNNCAIRPCLRWIRSPDAQGNATVFLAKFYGRAGLVNLITAGPQHVRPAIFRSLLYEACGRVLNPVDGSVGLLRSGNWQLCEAAVESVLRGMPIAQPPLTATAVPPLRSCDIRHFATREGRGARAVVDTGLHRIATSSRAQFKRSGANDRSSAGSDSGFEIVFSQPLASSMLVDIRRAQPLNWWAQRQPSHDYSASHEDGAVRESNSNASVDTGDVSHVSQSKPEPRTQSGERATDGLDLTLGQPPTAPKVEPLDVDDDQPCHRGEPIKLGLAMADSRVR